MVAVIRLVFQQFRLLGTAFKVMRYFATNQIPWEKESGDRVRWVRSAGGLSTTALRERKGRLRRETLAHSAVSPHYSNLTQPDLYWHLCLWSAT